MYLWFKLLHIFFMISWFAGLFYLPRIYVNLAQVDPQAEPAEYERLLGMAQRLYKFMSPLGDRRAGVRHRDTVCQRLVGIRLGTCQAAAGPAAAGLPARLPRPSAPFCEHACRHSHKWYRVFNEIPVLMMVAALYLVVFKPF